MSSRATLFHDENREKIGGYLIITGENGTVGNNGLRFYIEDPWGAVIYDVGMVKGRHDFHFTVEYSGDYTLLFDNSLGLSKITVFAHYHVIYRRIGHEYSLHLTLIGLGLCFYSYILALSKREDGHARNLLIKMLFVLRNVFQPKVLLCVKVTRNGCGICYA